MNKKTIIVSLFLLPILSLASEEAAHHATEIPFDKIGWQATNLGILLVIIFIFIRKFIAETFANRQASFLSQSEKTQAALRAAEASLAEVKKRIKDIEQDEEASLKRAEHEANVLKAHLIKESEDQAKKIKEDVYLLIAAEVEKTKNKIKESLFDGAVATIESKIKARGEGAKQNEEEFVKQLAQVKL